MGRPARPPPSLSASPHLNLRGLVFNFIKKKVSVALSFFCCGFFFSVEVFYRYRFLYLYTAANNNNHHPPYLSAFQPLLSSFRSDLILLQKLYRLQNTNHLNLTFNEVTPKSQQAIKSYPRVINPSNYHFSKIVKIFTKEA
jgi:hypothetical protein